MKLHRFAERFFVASWMADRGLAYFPRINFNQFEMRRVRIGALLTHLASMQHASIPIRTYNVHHVGLLKMKWLRGRGASANVREYTFNIAIAFLVRIRCNLQS